MKSPNAWAVVLQRLHDKTQSTFVRGAATTVLTEILGNAGPQKLVLMTLEEFQAGMRESFLEGQRFQHEHSLEGALGRTASEIAQASQRIGRLKLPEPMKWTPPKPPDPPRGTPIIHYAPRSRRSFDADFKKLARKMLQEQERATRARLKRR